MSSLFVRKFDPSSLLRQNVEGLSSYIFCLCCFDFHNHGTQYIQRTESMAAPPGTMTVNVMKISFEVTWFISEIVFLCKN